MKSINIFLAAAVIMTFAVSWAYAAVETKNLLRNGDFEESGTPIPGWKIDASPGESYELTSNALTGKNALKISLPVVEESVTAASDPVDVLPGENYLFTYWSRGDGDKKGGTAVAYAYIVWQDAAGKQISNIMSNYYSPPVSEYRAFTYVATAPTGAAKAQVLYNFLLGKDYNGSAVAFYLDQVRLMKLSKISIPADAQKWQYLNRPLSAGLKMVDDKDAVNGQAIIAESGTTTKNTPLAYGPYTKDQKVGEYVAVFRLKVKDNTKKEPVALLDVISASDELADQKTVYASDFKQPGGYQDFAIRFVRPEEGALEFRVFYQGTTDLSYDKVTVFQLGTFSDKEQAAIWLGE